MSDLPTGWEWTTLGEACNVVLGQSPPGSSYNDSGDGLPFFQGKAEFGALYPTVQTWTTAPKKFAEIDDVLLSVRAPVGPTNLAAVECAIGRGLAAIQPSPAASSRFILWWLRSSATRLAEGGTGTTFKAVTGAQVRAHPIPLPPRAEQERIVAALEEHLSRLDAAEEAIQTAERRIIALVKGIILEIAAVRNPPAHWQMTTVGEAGNVSLGLQRSPKRHRGPNMRPYLRVANVFEDRIDDSDVMEMNMSDDEWERFKLRNGDVLLNEGQSPEFLGRPAIYRGEPVGVAFTNSLIRFQANDGVDPEWALLVFRAHMHSRRFMDESQITTNIAHLSAGRLKAVEFPVPPLAEQRERVRRSRERLDGVDHLADGATRMRQHATVLRQSILAAAFSGKLVPQDPSDEPASVLLERIRAERAATKPTRRPKAKTP
ncbi:MAG: restriction endonuclease subunit S [Actinobacteria bacterium]|nr:restriction endonuclease subunit S [Actinomycetota bacterium]